jgi:broad specificity phosphatase PhoE
MKLKRNYFLKLKKHILRDFLKIKDVVSVNLVGSFWENPTEDNFRDIDIVVILKKINKKKFNNCVNFVNKIKLKLFGLEDYKIIINTTFGPLKFDIEKTLVFHLMIYDEESHKNHVIKSPFTCYDWERTKFVSGKKLNNIFPVSKLQFNDFLDGRRSIKDYQKDLKKNRINYGEYNWVGKKVFVKKKYFKISDWQKVEFLYHVVKNILFNYFKLINQINSLPNDIQLKKLLIKIDSKNYKKNENNFFLLRTAKKNKLKIKIKSIEKWVFKFTRNFQNFLASELENKTKVIFLRHCKTKLNDGSFLGVNRDPEIILNKSVESKIKKLKTKRILHIFSSEMKRCIQTSRIISKKIKLNISKNLNEKNYGYAEGMKYEQLIKKFPHLLKSWKNKKDPKFPGGENDIDVLKRLNIFKNRLIKTIKKSGVVFVVTHNVVLKNLIGSEFGIKRSDWFKINVDHLSAVEFILIKNRLTSNFNRNILLEKKL